MKKIFFLISFIGLSLLFNACSVRYVSEEPRYQESYRPARPSETHIWIEGNWYWDNRARTYHRRDGNWVRPDQGRSYEPGHWKRTRHGYYWVPGRWR